MKSSVFTDRREAGEALADAVEKLALQDPVVLALPRGGAPVGFEVARRLRAPLDLLFVRKIGAPGHPEYGLGAVVDGADPQLVLNEATRGLPLPPGYVERQTKRELAEIERRRQAYLGQRRPEPVRGRTAVVVDDGIATGGTVRAALAGLREAGAVRIVLAVPVAPAEALWDLRPLASDVVCLMTPEPFYAVGLHFRDFAQTTDDEVVRLLGEARAWRDPPRREPGEEMRAHP